LLYLNGLAGKIPSASVLEQLISLKM